MNDLPHAVSNIPEYTVLELSGALRRTLEDAFGRVRVRGEVTEAKRYGSGHIYFALKEASAKLDAVAWKSAVPRLGLLPENGVEVIATGRLTAYADRSRYQLVVERLEYAGVGALLARIEAIRLRLAGEGLFEASRKRVLPLLPRVIGVVTSERGAVIQDIRTTVERRFPRRILLWPVPVQGEGAAERIAAAIRGFDALPPDGAVPRPDVLIVARGGGSLEDLMAFNEEAVVRAAAACRIPLISAVGHETDTTLIDHVADRRAPTPTAAAEMAVPVRAQCAADLAHTGARLLGALSRLAQERRLALGRAERGLPDAAALLGTARQRLDDRSARLALALPNLLAARRAALVRAERGMPDLRAAVTGARHRWEGCGRALLRALPDLVAARRAALVRAERGLPDAAALLGTARQRLDARAARLLLATPNLLAARRAALVRAERGMPDLRGTVTGARHRWEGCGRALLRTLPSLLAQRRARLEGFSARLDSVSHVAVLARGYALVFDASGHPVTEAASVRPHAALRIRFADGEVRATAAGRGDARQGALPL
ncbi:MAG: exodeoxyribonuclease VII large subunit [Acidisphaera sp.]|nr:exodeoxyribonuclease VII large subunit [Acidisphaera sp.]